MNLTLTSRSAKDKQQLTPTERNLRRRLILQDSIALLSLTLITIAMAVLTYFLFHSFREHRRILEQRWFARGTEALSTGHPQDAVQAFRSALSLSSTNSSYELALAEALAAAGRTEEAYAYFFSLRDAEPGDGFLNLQLARLSARRRNSTQAISFYRSALNGAWQGQGTAQRLQIRIELAKYLLSLGNTIDAQGDLLTAEGNSLDNPAALFEIASLLRQADDSSDAWIAYQRVERHSRANPSQILRALLGEAGASSSMGQYKRAALALDRFNALARLHPSASTPEEKRTALQEWTRLQRMVQLIPFYGLQPRQRARRVLLARDIAYKRYKSCLAQVQVQNDTDSGAVELAALQPQWQSMAQTKLRTLADDLETQRNLMALVNQTEIIAANLCGQPSGDDALLLQLAKVPDKTE